LERKVERRTHELVAAKEEVTAKAELLQVLLSRTTRVQEAERARIARDMHDGVVQLVTAARYELQAARIASQSGMPTRTQEQLSTARDVLHEIEQEIRHVIYDLMPSALNGGGLIPALQKYIDNLQDYAGHVEDARVPSMAFQASSRLRDVREELAEQNPIYDRLKEIIAEGLDTGATVGIFSQKNGWIDIIENALAEDEQVSSKALVDGRLRVLGPDTARETFECDGIVATGPLPAQLGGYYLLPGTERTVVLTYEGAWGRMVERHAADYVERMNDAIDGLEVRPYPEPAVEVEWEPEEPAKEEAVHALERREIAEPISAEAEGPSGRSGSTPRSQRTGLERLAEAFERTEVGEFEEDQGRYGEETYRTYEVTTAAGESLELGNHDTYLRERPDGTHHWVSPSALSAGDTISIIDPDVETELWREHLEALYDDELGESDATAGVQIWYDALKSIAETTAAELGTDADNPENLREIAAFLQEEGVSRTSATIRSWFNSVLVASDALDLARDSSLRIGPRRVGDVRTVGEAFDHDALANGAERIERSMNAVRRLNQSEGMEFRQELMDMVDAEDSNRTKSATTQHEIAAIEMADEKEEDEEPDDNPSA
jgi:hypothetical protein